MHFANERWLQLFRYSSLTIQALFAFGFIVYAIMPITLAFRDYLTFLEPITPINTIIASIHIIFALFIYRSIALKNEILAPTILGALLLLNTIGMLHAAGGLGTLWIFFWLAVCALFGILGIALVSVPPFLITLYYVLFQVSAFNSLNGQESFIDTGGLAAVLATYAVSFASWRFWRRYYISTENVELKRLSGQLEDRQQVSDALIESITDGIIVIDTSGKITLMNSAAADMTEWSISESIGIDMRNVIHLQEEDGKPIPENEDVFSYVLSKQEPVERVQQLAGRNGKKQMVSLAVSPITTSPNNELTGAVAVMRDVSAAHAEEARRADFISTASHEMRTPVAAIEGYLALALNEKVSKLDSNARTYLQKAYSSTQHLGKLFQDLLTSAKAEDGRLVSHPTVVDLGDLVEQLAEDLRFSAEKKGLIVDKLIGAPSQDQESIKGGKNIKPLYYVMADPDRLREVITNLFDNAIKYTDSGKITIGLTGNREIAQLFIKDTGAGIPEDDIPHLFQKFYRVDNSSTRTVGGTGLGLFISRKIIEVYNGRMWVESKLGKGSTFYINLPRLSSQEADAAKKQQETSNEN